MITLDFTQSSNKQCIPAVTHDEQVLSYKSLQDAKVHCAREELCIGIHDYEFCNGNNYRLCEKGSLQGSHSHDCVYTKRNI